MIELTSLQMQCTKAAISPEMAVFLYGASAGLARVTGAESAQ